MNIHPNPLFNETNINGLLNDSFDNNIIRYLDLIDPNINNSINLDIYKLYENIENDKIKEHSIFSQKYNFIDNYLKKYINWIKYYNILIIKQENIIKKTKNSKYLYTMIYQYFKNITIFKKLIMDIKQIIPENTPNCDICISNNKNIVFVPCGHSICNECFNVYINKYNYKKCHICRKYITNSYKIFL